MENKILPIVHFILKMTKTHQLFYTFAKNTAVVFLLVVKIAASLFLPLDVYLMFSLPLGSFLPKKYISAGIEPGRKNSGPRVRTVSVTQ